MPPLAIGLILLSCGLHAVWNLLLKRAHDKLAFTALYLSVIPVLYLPMFLSHLPQMRLTAAGWVCVFGTSLAYFGYFVGLAVAYQRSDLSLIYPLTRGLGPALAFLGGILLLSDAPTGMGAAGVGMILLGILVLHGKGGTVGLFSRGWRVSALLPVLVVGLMYSLYSMIDKVAVGRLRIPPPLYIYLTFAVTALFVVPWIARRQGVGALRAEWRLNARSCVAVGVLNVLAYLLVLYAMSIPGTPVSYVVPLRTTSVLIGVALGARVLGEERFWTRFCGGLMMMAGIVLIAWKG